MVSPIRASTSPLTRAGLLTRPAVSSQEIVSIYPLLTPPALTAHASNRVCNALALLQCVASHQETRSLFLQGAITDTKNMYSQLILKIK